VQWLIERKKFLVRSLVSASPQPMYVYSDLPYSAQSFAIIVNNSQKGIRHFVEVFTKYCGNAENIDDKCSLCKMDLDVLGTFLKYFKSYLSFLIGNAVPHISAYGDEYQKKYSPLLMAVMCIFNQEKIELFLHRQAKGLSAENVTEDNLEEILSVTSLKYIYRRNVALFPYVSTNMTSLEGGTVSSKYRKEQEVRALKAIREWFVCTNNILFEYTIPREISVRLSGQSVNSDIRIAGIAGFEFPLELRDSKEFGNIARP